MQCMRGTAAGPDDVAPDDDAVEADAARGRNEQNNMLRGSESNCEKIRMKCNDGNKIIGKIKIKINNRKFESL